MGRSKRGTKKSRVAVETFDSDDERAYSREEVPDERSSSYYHDEIDEFHLAKEKVLLKKGAQIRQQAQESSEEEVLGFSDDSEDNDETIAKYEDQLRKMRNHSVREKIASDVEEESDDEEDDSKPWGKTISKFYGDDTKKDKKGRKKKTKAKLGGSDSEDLDEDLLEEQEARKLQKQQLEQLTEDDFGLSVLQNIQVNAEQAEQDQIIVKDISSMTEQEKRQLLAKESPELMPIIEDYKLKLSELHNTLLPLMEYFKKGLLEQNSGVAYLLTKTRLYFNYCTNVSFYLVLKLQRQSVQDHPVIKRIVEYRNMIKRLEVADNRLSADIKNLLQEIKKTKQEQEASLISMDKIDIDSLLQDSQAVKRKKKLSKKNLEVNEDDSMNEEEDSSTEEKMEEEEIEDEDDDGRRAINYEIAKNKGLKPQRKKELRNPRVKHKLKYRKALIRRRGQIRPVRPEVSKYGGEISGIRAGVKKSIKLKV